jgi:hypothetical protein
MNIELLISMYVYVCIYYVLSALCTMYMYLNSIHGVANMLDLFDTVVLKYMPAILARWRMHYIL